MADKPIQRILATDLGLVAPGNPAWFVVQSSLVPVGAHTLYAVINGVTYDGPLTEEHLAGALAR